MDEGDGGRCGPSTSSVSMVEHGQRLLDRYSHVSASTSALRVSETRLVEGPHLLPSADPQRFYPHGAIPDMSMALQSSMSTSPATDGAGCSSVCVAGAYPSGGAMHWWKKAGVRATPADGRSMTDTQCMKKYT